MTVVPCVCLAAESRPLVGLVDAVGRWRRRPLGRGPDTLLELRHDAGVADGSVTLGHGPAVPRRSVLFLRLVELGQLVRLEPVLDPQPGTRS